VTNPRGPARHGERGQAALFATMTLTISLGLMGLVVDEGWGYWRQEACVTAAQSAAVAGAMYAFSNNTTWPPTTCTTNSAISCSATPVTCPTSLTLGTNATSVLNAACLYAKQNGFTASGRQNVTVATNTGNPPTTSGVSTAYYVTVRASEQVPLTFLAAIVGQTNHLVSGRATAAVTGGSSGGCVYVLQNSGTDITSSGGQISSNCGVYVDSNGAAAILMSGGNITTSGGSKTTIATGGACLGGGCVGISPAYVNGPAEADPLSGMTTPNAATMGAAYTTCQDPVAIALSSGSKAMTPGLYCHGITISGGSVTLATGAYIFQGGITMSGGSITSLAGGVMIYEQTGGIDISGGTITMSAMTSGTYSGVLIFQDRSNASGVTMSGATQTYTGAVYAPDASLTMSGGTFTQTTFVAKTITMSGGGTATINGSSNTQWTPGAAPALVE
jgi:hypothetical protein